jgi:protein-disulfide isomerase
MKRSLHLAAALACTVLVAPAAARAQSFNDQQKGELGSIIREYLVQHPEVLQEAMAELEKRQAAAEAEKAKAAVKNNAQTLFDSSRQVVVGNAQGDVTLVEFFDYNCGYCKRALTDLTDLMKDDSKLRVVLKEFPVLGPGSQEAAQVAIAARMQDKSGKKYFDFHQRLLGGRGPADRARALAAAKDAGFDMARPAVKATIEENMKLAEQLGLNGTPSYVVGSDVVVGAVGLEALKGKVKAARCTTASC